jgi:hypothetical protein
MRFNIKIIICGFQGDTSIGQGLSKSGRIHIRMDRSWMLRDKSRICCFKAVDIILNLRIFRVHFSSGLVAVFPKKKSLEDPKKIRGCVIKKQN